MNDAHKMLKRIIIIIFIVLLLGGLIVFLYFYLWFKIGIIELKKQHNKNIEIELQNRNENILIFDEYIKNTYGIVSETFEIEVKSGIVSIDTNFDVKASFMEKPFRIIVDTDNKKIYKDNFYEVLARDEKFNHLYSEWVKKQIGCEDENIELKFANFDINKSISINFANIKNVSKNLDDIFKNVSNFYLIEIYKKNIKDLSNMNYKQYADDINNKHYIKIIDLIGKSEIEHYVELYNNNVNLLDINYHLLLGKADYSKVEVHYEVEYE